MGTKPSKTFLNLKETSTFITHTPVILDKNLLNLKRFKENLIINSKQRVFIAGEHKESIVIDL